MPAPKHSKAAIKAHPAPVRADYQDGKDYAEACRLVSEARDAFDSAKPKGRPTKYRDYFPAMAKSLCLLGSTDKQLAEAFDVDEASIHRWKLEHPEFCESIKEGKVDADAKVAASLFSRAVGYTGRRTVTATVGGMITDVKEIREYVGPDVGAAVFWLKNRQKENWRDKQDLEHTGANGGPIQIAKIERVIIEP